MPGEDLIANPYQAPNAGATLIDNAKTSKKFLRVHVIAWGYPLLLLAMLYLTWFAAWLALGHMPRPSLDDPKAIGIGVDLPYWLTGILLIGTPWAVLSGVGVQVVLSDRSIPQRIVDSLFLILFWIAIFALLRWDPLQVANWYMD